MLALLILLGEYGEHLKQVRKATKLGNMVRIQKMKVLSGEKEQKPVVWFW